MRLHFLGTGSSTGSPMIGCECPVCLSGLPKNRRRRSCLYVTTAKTAFVIDTPPDFREQMLEAKVRSLDAVVFTHAHADHIFGFDDIRRFNTLREGAVLPAYGPPGALAIIQRDFSYIRTSPHPLGLFRPMIKFYPVVAPFEIGDVRLTPVPVEHGTPTCGYVLEHAARRAGYLCDCRSIPQASMELLRGLDLLAIDCLREKPHPTHLAQEECFALARKIGAKHTCLVHISHSVDHDTLAAKCPPRVFPAYDGMVAELDAEISIE